MATPQLQPGAQQSWIARHFTLLLCAIAAAGIIPCLFVAPAQYIGYDGWWHLFTATQDQWINFLREWKYEAHPPLHYLLLRLVAGVGHSRLMLGSIGIVASAFSTWVIGVIASKICCYRISALLAAAAYALAWNMIPLECEVRAYPLALLFVLLAFNAFIDLIAAPGGPSARRAVLRFGGYSVVALLSEYYTGLFLVGCGVLVALRLLIRRDFRAAFLESVPRNGRQYFIAVASIFAVFALLFGAHVGGQEIIRGTLDPYLWSERSPYSLDQFLSTNFALETSYFTPLGLDPAIMLALVVLVLLPSLLWFAFLRKERWRAPATADAPLMLILLLCQIVVLSLAGRYPFGGESRHQSILAPFVFLTAFLVLDRVAGTLPGRLPRQALFAATVLLIAANLAFGWRSHTAYVEEPRTADYRHFQEVFPSPETVYADALSSRFYYAQTHQATWTFDHGALTQDQYIGIYHVADNSGHRVRYMRNKSRTLFDLSDPATYQVLAGALREEHLNSAVLFYNGTDWTVADAVVLEQNARRLAPRAGLEYGRASVGPNYAFIEFKIR
ncbi:MAG TPA: hypothetical protein VGL72_17255 [Bryobacteraceae bacterium]|jgi:hypothetical protein